MVASLSVSYFLRQGLLEPTMLTLYKRSQSASVNVYNLLLSKRIFEWANTAGWGWAERAENVAEKFSTRGRRFQEFLVYFFSCAKDNIFEHHV